MGHDWIPRENEAKNHFLWDESAFGTEAPCTVYEKRPVLDASGAPVDGLYSAWITLNNPAQYNSYTTAMVKGVIAGFQRASADNSVVAAVFTGAGDRAFCTGGNTKEYAEYYSARPNEYGQYMDLFNAMVDGILNCKKPTICRVNGMRIAGGQEIGMACDITISADTALFGQAGPRHGSAPDGGSTDFLPWFLPMESAMWNCVSCDIWSSYKMHRLGLITRLERVLVQDGAFIADPRVITETYLRDGVIAYGEMKGGEEMKQARALAQACATDFSRLDAAIHETVWKFANLFPGCLIKSVDGVRAKKKFFWDQTKLANRHWLAANMTTEAYLGFNAFNTKKLTGKDVIDFIEYRRLIAAGHPFDDALIEAVMAPPLQSK